MKRFKVFISLVLSLLIIFSTALCVPVNAADEDFQVSLNWNSNNDPQNLVWNATSALNKVIRLNVNYKSVDTRSATYAPNSLVITVNGLGAAYRSASNIKADSIAADLKTDAKKKYDWSYTYNASTDIYTFYNNNTIDAETTFSGSFEILWNLNPRNIKGYAKEDQQYGYEKTFSATLTYNGVTSQSNDVKFSFVSSPDTFSLTQKAQPLSDRQGLNDFVPFPSEYQWVTYTVQRQQVTKARGVASSFYEVQLGDDVVVAHSNASFLGNGRYKINVSADKFELNVGYLKSVYMISEETNNVTAAFEYIGNYYDETETQVLASSSQNINLNDYGFTSGNGGGKFSEENVKLKYNHLFNGEQAYLFYFDYTGSANKDVIICDDFVDILLNNGEYRQLEPDEYEIAEVRFPTILDLKDENGAMLAENRRLEIWGQTAGNDEYELVYSGIIGGVEKWIQMPQNTYRIQYRWSNGSTHYATKDAYQIHMIFHLRDESNLPFEERVSSSGELRNLCYCDVYKGDTHLYGTEENYTGLYAERNRQRDIELYGHLWRRTYDFYYVVKGDNYYSTYVELKDFKSSSNAENNITFVSQAQLISGFEIDKSIGDVENLTEFTQYTVLPTGMNIDVENFTYTSTAPKLTFENGETLNSTLGYIKRHIYVDIIENYRNSGRTYVAFKYDFSDNPIVISDKIEFNVLFDVFVTMDAYKEYGESYMLNGITMVKLPGGTYIEKDTTGENINKRYTSYASVDAGEYFNVDIPIWTDINNNSDTEETLSYNFNNKSIVLAMASYQEVKETVKTYYTNNSYVTGLAKSNLGGNYTYKFGLSTGISMAKNIEFVSILENTDNAEWQGVFQSVDTTYAESKGLIPTIYYASTTTPTDSDWTVTKPKSVKAVKVVLDGTLADNSLVYVLVNMVAPSDETLVDKIAENEYSVSFTAIDAMTGIETQEDSLPSNIVQVELVKNVGNIKILKLDQNSGAHLEGATFDLYRKNFLGIYTHQKTLKTNATGSAILKTVKFGEYYIVETDAPQGYILNEDPIYFTLSEETMDSSVGTITVTVENSRILGRVQLTKVDWLFKDVKVRDAVYGLFKSSGELVRDGYTTDENGQFTATDIDWGSYYFLETRNPPGYEINDEKLPFEIDAENAAALITLETDDYPKCGFAKLIKYDKPGPDDPITSQGVSGGTYKVFQIMSDGSEEEQWSYLTKCTNEEGILIVSQLYAGQYYFVESNKPIGYALNPEKIYFEITPEDCESGVPVTVTTYDVRVPGTATLLKTNKEDVPLKNAVYTLYNSDGSIYMDDLVTDENGLITVTDLPWASYYFKEKSPPKGYTISDAKIEFVIDRFTAEAANVYHVVDEQQLTNVVLKKVSSKDKTVGLEGAVFSLFNTDTLALYGENYVTDKNGYLTVENLPWGNYFFMETKAPEGYTINSDRLYFSLNSTTAGKNIELVAENDPEVCEITVTKKINANDIYWEHGSPIFTFTLKSLSDPSVTYNRIITFDKDYVDSHTDENGYVEKNATFSNLIHDEYVLVENNTIRYDIIDITTPEDGTGTIYKNGDGTELSTIYGDCVLFDLTNDKTGTATFTNQKTDWGRASDTAAVVNLIPGTKKLVGLAVYSNIPVIDVSNTSELDKSLIDVYALYSDGTKAKIPSDDFIIEDQAFGEGTETYTINIIYTENGITKAGSFQAFTYAAETIQYMRLTDGTWAITGYSGNAEIVVFPSEHNGIPVTQVGNGLTNITGLENAKTIIIPETVVSIGANAFAGYSQLKSLEMPISTTINENAFDGVDIMFITFTPGTGISPEYNYETIKYTPWGNSSGCGIEFRNGIRTISSHMFEECNILGRIVLPDTVTDVGKYAFSNCKKITEVTLSKSMTEVKEGTFQYCDIIDSISFPENIKKIHAYAFADCFNISSLVLPKNLTYIGDCAFAYLFVAASEMTDRNLIIPDGVTVDGAGFRSAQIAELHVGQNVDMSDTAFNEAHIDNIYIDEPFDCMNNVPWNNYGYYLSEFGLDMRSSSVHWGAGETIQDESGLLYYVENDKAVVTKYNGTNTDVVIPDVYNSVPVVAIDAYAFFENQNVRSVTIGSNIQSIGSYAFLGCFNLESFNFTGSNRVIRIGDWAFAYCSQLSSELYMTDNLMYLGYEAFYECNNLTGSIYVSQNLSYVYDNTFYNCENLTGDLYVPDNIKYIGMNAFYGCRNIGPLLRLPEDLEVIDYYAFCGTQSITTVIWPKNLKSIGSSAFGYSGLSGTLELPDSVEFIGDGAFRNTGISGTLRLPANLKAIAQTVFVDCIGITGVVTNEVLESVGHSAFGDCTSLTGTITLPESTSFIAAFAFAGCTNLKKLIILNPNCKIANSYSINNAITICGYAGSTAEVYAKKYNKKFELITE